MTTIITFILCLTLLVFLHELGHYLAARYVGVDVLEFSIGFPPKIFSKKFGNTVYMISAIPLGGFVRLKGQNIDDEDPTEEGNYASKTAKQKLLILLAGPVMNLITALIIMPMVYLVGVERPEQEFQPLSIYQVVQNSAAEKAGFLPHDLILEVDNKITASQKDVEHTINEHFSNPTILVKVQREGRKVVLELNTEIIREQQNIGFIPYMEPKVGPIMDGSPASRSNLQTGDLILQIGDFPIESWHNINPAVQANKDKETLITVLRRNQEVVFPITPTVLPGKDRAMLGIGAAKQTQRYGLSESISKGVERVYFLTKLTFNFLGKLFSGDVKEGEVGGPVMIANMLGDAANHSFARLLALMSYISLQLGIMNLLPIPALDGGHIFFILIEKLKGSQLSQNFRAQTQQWGFILLMILIITITIQDVFKLSGGG